MKKILIPCFLFLALILVGKGLSAQKLEFNQVILKTFTAYSTLDTVPAGKVWKIEGAGSSNSVFIQNLNGLTVGQGINTNSSSNNASNLPIWLPAGTSIQFWENGNYSLVSIIEFNVVP